MAAEARGGGGGQLRPAPYREPPKGNSLPPRPEGGLQPCPSQRPPAPAGPAAGHSPRPIGAGRGPAGPAAGFGRIRPESVRAAPRRRTASHPRGRPRHQIELKAHPRQDSALGRPQGENRAGKEPSRPLARQARPLSDSNHRKKRAAKATGVQGQRWKTGPPQPGGSPQPALAPHGARAGTFQNGLHERRSTQGLRYPPPFKRPSTHRRRACVLYAALGPPPRLRVAPLTVALGPRAGGGVAGAVLWGLERPWRVRGSLRAV